MKSTFKTQMTGTQPAISKEAFLNFREADPPGGSDSWVEERVIFSFFIFSRLHLFGLV